ncbi:uncharacterized protein Pyn_08052 [Prunus yedoensis var. nudiflora]|uniref:RRM domain-containing protein n=1 Tax=Prunus yedoensis var. nudiflora TaxID=2094558 RepID=A0A314YMF0_PRUYE|nr:uncharacterized protein Pyn_08052 [Prunus yedoensis var. nudiflora]
MQVMALWLWLEKVGFKNAVKKILSLPFILINELADEAVTCLDIINGTHFSLPFEANDIPLLQSFMEKEVSLQFFHENQQAAAQGVTKAANIVCLPAFDDIMKQAIEINFSQNSADHSQVISSSSSSSFSSSSSIQQQQLQALPQILVPPNERTMFVTFSKGYPVHEHEVKQFFTAAFGDCVESLQMQEVQPFEQSLFARVVFHSASTIEAILSGVSKAKFTINGKHVWVRRFVPKRARSLLPQMTWQPIFPFGPSLRGVNFVGELVLK